MALQFHWLGEESQDRVVEVRLRSFGAGGKERGRFADATRVPVEPMPRDFLVASIDGQDVGTTCSINLNMWISGAKIPCQGVGYVGTAKTHRRGGGGEKGLASQMMWQTVAKARERGHIVSALMPFRASYYEHFGYGVVERRNEWVVPTNLFPQGDCAGFRFYEEKDLPALMECRNQVARSGQCDAERTEQVWRGWFQRWEDRFVFVDRPDVAGPIQSWIAIGSETIDGKPGMRVRQMGYVSNDALLRQLHFLSSLQDQHMIAGMSLPADLPLNWLLRESLVPLNYASHRVSQMRCNTRMMIKIIDHAKFLSSIHWPADVKGSAVVGIAEADGNKTVVRIDVEGGKASAKKATGEPQFECPERVWGPIVCGEMSASTAVQYGLAKGDAAVVTLLDSLARGKKPYCIEYF